MPGSLLTLARRGAPIVARDPRVVRMLAARFFSESRNGQGDGVGEEGARVKDSAGEAAGHQRLPIDLSLVENATKAADVVDEFAVGAAFIRDGLRKLPRVTIDLEVNLTDRLTRLRQSIHQTHHDISIDIEELQKSLSSRLEEIARDFEREALITEREVQERIDALTLPHADAVTQVNREMTVLRNADAAIRQSLENAYADIRRLHGHRFCLMPALNNEPVEPGTLYLMKDDNNIIHYRLLLDDRIIEQTIEQANLQGISNDEFVRLDNNDLASWESIRVGILQFARERGHTPETELDRMRGHVRDQMNHLEHEIYRITRSFRHNRTAIDRELDAIRLSLNTARIESRSDLDRVQTDIDENITSMRAQIGTFEKNSKKTLAMWAAGIFVVTSLFGFIIHLVFSLSHVKKHLGEALLTEIGAVKNMFDKGVAKNSDVKESLERHVTDTTEQLRKEIANAHVREVLSFEIQRLQVKYASSFSSSQFFSKISWGYAHRTKMQALAALGKEMLIENRDNDTVVSDISLATQQLLKQAYGEGSSLEPTDLEFRDTVLLGKLGLGEVIQVQRQAWLGLSS